MEDDLLLAEVDGEGMLIDVEKGMSFFLNETALSIYKMLKQGKNMDEIKTLLSEEFEIDENDVEKDIRDFYALLEQKGVSWPGKDTSNRK